MTKAEAFKEINDTQEFYINKLVDAILDDHNDCLKTINFTSPTGTGKTNMMSLLCNKLPEYYFIVTTLSKGQLNTQIKTNMSKLVNQKNFTVYGLCDYTSNTKRTAADIISLLPTDKKIIWLRDEGHINTNKWQEILNARCYKIINISATNKEATGVKCNFTNTMMLRTVHQNIGTPEDALDKLLEVKKQHKKVKGYNPCAIMRCLDSNIENQIIAACEERKLKYINITTENFDMTELCEDDNEYDVILNKFKIVEGIDLRRAHVVYMTNEPSNTSTTIQIIGRCRRNALLYRNDIDIFDKANKTLLNNTRQCFVFYNVENMNVDQDENGELCQAFCDTISCQELKPNSTIHVEDGQMDNGLNIIELRGETGNYRVEVDSATGFNIIKPEGVFYSAEIQEVKFTEPTYEGYTELELADKTKFPRKHAFNYATGELDGEEYVEIDLPERTVCQEKTLLLGSELCRIINKYKGYQYYFKKRYCAKSIVVEIFKLKSSITLNHVNVANSMMVSDAIIDNYETSETKRFKTESKADDFIRTHVNKKMNVKINYFSAYKKTKHTFFNTSYFTLDSTETANKLVKEITRAEDFDPTVLITEISPARQVSVRSSRLNEYFKNAKHNTIQYYDYIKTVNDRESAIVGTDLLKRINTNSCTTTWIEDKAVTGKVSRYTKFNTFIQDRYAKELLEAKALLFSGKNSFNFNSKCNSCLGYCVEYYSKYLAYGERYLGSFLDEAMRESKATELNNFLIVRACMLKYRDNMMRAYGANVAKVIKTISVEQLIKDSYKEFVATVIKLGTKTANFVKEKMNIVKPLEDGDKMFDPNLSIKHIAGLADYINEDTIIDIKTTNSININYIKQVLAYHYLSTKRTDLHIKRVIVYDAVSDRSVEVNL